MAGDLATWRERFGAELPFARHMTFGWDAPDGAAGAIAPFEAAGFTVERTTVLVAHAVKPPAHAAPISVRPLDSDDDWEQALANQIRCSDDAAAADPHFRRAQMVRYRAMMTAGLGAWHGAFMDGQLVGDLGLYFDGAVGRFQSVGTHPRYRRRGICQTLVYEVARSAFTAGVETLVMAADPDYHAARIYESLGFIASEKQIGVQLPPPAE